MFPREPRMNVTPDIISRALFHILRQRQICEGVCIGMETMQQAWQGTGLRTSDLQCCLRDLEDAGIINVCLFEPRAYIELTKNGADRLSANASPDAAEQSWMDDVVLYRIRQRARSNFVYEHRRTTDSIDSTYS